MKKLKRQSAARALAFSARGQLGDFRRDPPAKSRSFRLDLNQVTLVQSMLIFSMTLFMYRCPRTGQIVHGHFANDLISSGETYEPVTCTACGSTHLVNQKTGKLLDDLKKG
jgi:hypothetical protein